MAEHFKSDDIFVAPFIDSDGQLAFGVESGYGYLNKDEVKALIAHLTTVLEEDELKQKPN